MMRAYIGLFVLGLIGCVGDSTVTGGDAGPDVSVDVSADTSVDVASGCEAGAMSCNGTCTPVGSDPANCGRCAHDCGTGATCKAGICQPVLVTNAPGAVALITEATPDN